MKKFYLLSLVSAFSILLSNLSFAANDAVNGSEESVFKTIFSQTHHEINPDVLHLALRAFFKAQDSGVDKKPILTVIDYSLPSTKKRMWVFDLISQKILFNTIVAHGKNSGSNYAATKFSNADGSLESSIGVFLTENTYIGHDGYTLKIKGLEPGFNENADRRHIVIHGAWYVSQDLVDRGGIIGRSWGCPALDKKLAQPIIDTIKGGSVVFAYYPDKNWLASSRFIVA